MVEAKAKRIPDENVSMVRESQVEQFEKRGYRVLGTRETRVGDENLVAMEKPDSKKGIKDGSS